MEKMINMSFVALRALVFDLRSQYMEGMAQWKALVFRRNTLRHDELRSIQRKLIILVPLYRAIAAMRQQVYSLESPGVTAYQKRYDELVSKIRSDIACGRPLSVNFGGAVAQLQLLVPMEGVTMWDWPFATIAEIAESVREDFQVVQQQKVSLSREAEKARQAFLASLTAEQRELLNVALGNALNTGVHAISFVARDVLFTEPQEVR